MPCWNNIVQSQHVQSYEIFDTTEPVHLSAALLCALHRVWSPPATHYITPSQQGCDVVRPKNSASDCFPGFSITRRLPGLLRKPVDPALTLHADAHPRKCARVADVSWSPLRPAQQKRSGQKASTGDTHSGQSAVKEERVRLQTEKVALASLSKFVYSRGTEVTALTQENHFKGGAGKKMTSSKTRCNALGWRHANDVTPWNRVDLKKTSAPCSPPPS